MANHRPLFDTTFNWRIMRIVRTFHPVGQGAFYSERYYDACSQNASHNIVFDCGTLNTYLRSAKKVVSQAFDKEDVIDYLFISHLDFDHISLVETLENSVRLIHNIVLPLVYEEELVIAMAYHKLSGNASVVRFFKRIIDHLNGRYENDYTNGDYTIIFVGDQEQRIEHNQTWRSGEGRPLFGVPDWILMPHNVGYVSRKPELINQFDIVVNKGAFKKAVQSLGMGAFVTGDELYEKLKEESFIECVLSNKVLKSAIKKAYESITGKTNGDSLLLYSGPANGGRNYRVVRCAPYWRRLWYGGFESGCLYTGDNDCNLSDWKDSLFSSVWDKIWTIQLPHHGSLKSFDIEANHIDRSYCFPVSCGSDNGFGHPSGKVLAYLLVNGCRPQIVTEMASTIYMQEIAG